jgi:hypothetical protein
MPFRPPLPLAALAVVAGCASSPSVLECAGDAECGAGNVCVQGACVVNAPPVGAFEPPAAATTNRAYAIVPASSDPEGRAVTNGWSVKAIAGGCAPDTEPAADGGLEVIFWCAGTYELTLVPVDDLGLAGAAVVRSFEVAAATGSPSVTAGPAIAATHACDQAVPSCGVAAPGGSSLLQLEATGEDPEGSPITYEWVGLPPPVPSLDPSLSLTFVAGADVAAPMVTVANGSGGPIAGVYRFRVRVRDAEGLVGQDFQEVAVGNEPPTAKPCLASLPHLFTDGKYVAEADLPTCAIDPDGDAVEVAGALSPAPPEGCTEEVEASTVPGALHIRIACSAATSLVGGAPPRTLSVTITDSNGAAAAVSYSLFIKNRPPQIVVSPSFLGGVVKVDHWVGPCLLSAAEKCFVASGVDPFEATDPDGDPLSDYVLSAKVAADRTHSKASVWLADGVSAFRFETMPKFPLEFRSSAGATGFALSASAHDAFGATTGVSTSLFVGNRPPFVTAPAPTVSVNHSYDPVLRRYFATAEGASFADPDGDPLYLTISSTGPCTAVALGEKGPATITCVKDWDYAAGGTPPLASFLADGGVFVTASDAWEVVTSATYVTILDRPASVAIPVPAVENCFCAGMGGCIVTGLGAKVPVTLADPDGDPSLIALTSTVAPAPISFPVCLPGEPCVATTNLSVAGTTPVTATADSGAPGVHPSATGNVGVFCGTAAFF